MMTLIRIAFGNVILNWRHSLASILSVSAAFFSLNVFQGYIHDVGRLYYTSYRQRSMFGDLTILNRAAKTPAERADVWTYGLDPPLQDEIKDFIKAHSDEIQTGVRFLDLQGLITNGKISTIFFTHGYDLAEGAILRGDLWKWNTVYGEPLELHPEGGRILVGQALGHMLGCVPKAKMKAVAATGGYEPVSRPFVCRDNSMQLTVTTDAGQLNALDLDVVGLIDGGYLDVDSKFLWMSLPDAQTLMHTDRISYENLMLRNPDEIDRVASEFRDQFGISRPELKIIPWQDIPDIGDLYNQSMELLGVFRNFVSIVIVAISSLSVLNTMTKSLSERIREIGTLLAIGFRKTHIRIIFVTEAILLSLIGITVGGVVSLLVGTGINSAGIFYKAGLLSEPVPFRIYLMWQLSLISAVGLVLLAALATIWACRRALQKQIVECLHYA